MKPIFLAIRPALLSIASILSVLIFAGCGSGETVSSPTTVQAAATTATNHSVGAEQPAQPGVSIELPHIHGLGFSADGRQLLVPAHNGLRIYQDQKWSLPALPAHDYMGFSASDDGFYSSGHPDPAVGGINPLGLVKTQDAGKSLTKLGFAGESDFHLMAVSYHSHALYIANPAANSTLQAGIYYTLDDGQSWQPSAFHGVTSAPLQLAVHPSAANQVAVASEGGLFTSTDFGNTFTLIGDPVPISAVTFDPNGQRMLFGFRQLSALDLASKQFTPLSVPNIAEDDGINYIAVNAINTDQMALATYKRSLYFTNDSGKTWSLIAENGMTTTQ